MTTDRRQFFGGLRRALGANPGRSEMSDTWPSGSEEEVLARAAAVEHDAAARAGELIEQLASSAQAGGWIVHRAANPEDALGKVVDIARGLGVETMVRSDHDVLRTLGVDGPLAKEGIEVTAMASERSQGLTSDSQGDRSAVPGQGSGGAMRKIAIESGMGLTGADYAVAETGSVVLTAGQGVSRIVSLVPPVHVAVVEIGSVLPGLDELFTLLRRDYGRENWTSYVNIISGPSRSADIEYTLVTGVHGPGEVHLVLLG